MKLIATCSGPAPGTWELHHNGECDTRHWRSLVLVRSVEAPNRYGMSQNFFLGWNGDRLSVTPDFHDLRRHWPAILDWLNATLPIVTWWEEAK
jgi:hypothetical protein